jgi:chlorobactene glucosyltransferase
MPLIDILATVSAWVLGALAVVFVTNVLVTRRFDRAPDVAQPPRISVLVPARNEARHVEGCARALLAQDYPDFEVLVLDDESDDATPEILARLAAEDPRLRVLAGSPLPEGWTGKNHACHVLSQLADGELLLFCDADTRQHPATLRNAAALMVLERLDVLSAMPKMELPTLGTQLLVPFPAFAATVVQPRALAYRVRIGALGAINGQWTMYTREAYSRLGGHESVRGDAVEDLALGRKAAALGMRWRMEDATKRVSVRMYDSFGEGWRGFAKNYHSLAGPWPLSFAAWLLVLATTLAGPAAIVAGIVTVRPPAESALVAVALMGALWAGTAVFCRLRWSVVPLGWVILVVSSALGFRSIWLRLRGGATWKGRRLD